MPGCEVNIYLARRLLYLGSFHSGIFGFLYTHISCLSGKHSLSLRNLLCLCLSCCSKDTNIKRMFDCVIQSSNGTLSWPYVHPGTKSTPLPFTRMIRKETNYNCITNASCPLSPVYFPREKDFARYRKYVFGWGRKGEEVVLLQLKVLLSGHFCNLNFH